MKRTLTLLTVMVLVTVVASTGTGAVGTQPDRRVLEGVPKVDFGSRYCSFTASLEAVMKYLGDPVDYDYAMGVTGLAFRRLWSRDWPR